MSFTLTLLEKTLERTMERATQYEKNIAQMERDLIEYRDGLREAKLDMDDLMKSIERLRNGAPQ